MPGQEMAQDVNLEISCKRRLKKRIKCHRQRLAIRVSNLHFGFGNFILVGRRN